jgi:fatty acid-binding protein DegV
MSYLVAKVAADGPLERLAIADGACTDIDGVVKELAAIPTAHPLVSVQLGPVVGSHTGPDTLGVCYILPGADSAAGE